MPSESCTVGFLLVEEREFAAPKPKSAGAIPPTGFGGFIGCFMVTDERGYPKEFRITTPVKPSAIQRAIYGSELDSYVSQELVCTTLVKEATLQPELLIVNSPALAAFRSPSGIPVATLYQTHGGLLVGDEQEFERVETTGRELLFRVTEGFEVEAQRALTLCAAYFDPAKAFERMSAALDVLMQEDARFQ